jgi:hypothetical protein
MNKMKSISVSIIALFFTALIFSCTEDTTISTEDSAYVPIIYGTITDQNIRQQIQVSSSSGYFDKEANKRITNAIVTLKEDSALISHSYVMTQDSVGSGIYATQYPMRGKPGWTYRLSVAMDFNNDGSNEEYTAECKMPESLKVDSFNISKKEVGEYTLYSLNISAQDNGDEANYYMGKYSINGLMYNKISKYIMFNDVSLNGEYVKNLSVWNFNDIGDKSKFSDDDAKDMVFLSAGDSMVVEFSNISKAYFNFINECASQKNGSNPMFGGPPANISTNISNGARGFFTVYGVSVVSGKVPE